MNLKKMWKRFWNLNVHNHEGFTLVELIIVIAILAILSAVAVAGYSAYIKKANEGADKATLAQINSAFAAACAVNGVDWIDFKAPYPELAIDEANNKVTGLDPDTISSDVVSYFADSIGSGFTFQVYKVKNINYDPNTGCFVYDEMGRINPNYVNAYLNGKFDEYFEIAELMGLMDGVIEYAAGKLDGKFGDALGFAKRDPAFIEICKKFDADYPDNVTEDEKDQIEAQALVLYTSLLSADKQSEDIFTSIVNSNGNIVGLGNGENLDLVGNATMYSLGMIYAQSGAASAYTSQAIFGKTEDQPFDINNPDHVRQLMKIQAPGVDEWGDPDPSKSVNPFTQWVAANQEDCMENIEAFQAALGMIADNQDNLNHEDILAGGYDDDEDLIAKLEEVLGKGGTGTNP